MLLVLAMFFLGPGLAVVTFILGRYFLRSGRKGLTLVLVVGAVAVEALAIWAGIRQANYVTPASFEEKQAPGIYVRLGKDARDEVVLSPDGTFSRTATYRGVTQRQQGHWTLDRRPSPPDYITFTTMIPPCLRSTALPGAIFHYGEPNEVLCYPPDVPPGGTVGGFVCRAGGRLALCLGDDGFEYIKQDRPP